MSYQAPLPHKCTKCGYETDYSPDNGIAAPEYDNYTGCPECWLKFLKGNIGELKCTVDFSRDKSGSEYDKTI